MLNKGWCPYFKKLHQPVLALGVGITLLILLASTLTSTADASPPSQADLTPTPQISETPTVATLQLESTTSYSFSLSSLGYDEITLNSPYGTARYSFILPETWALQSDGVLNLELSYSYNQVDQEGPLLFGDLTVKFDSQTLQIFPIEERTLENYQLSVPLPASLLNNPNRTQHTIDLIFNAPALCGLLTRASLIIHPVSSIWLNYDDLPVTPDLSRYPRPFYQQAFEPDLVRFVLPAQLPREDLENGLGVAAKLGDLTRNRIVISSTTDLDFTELISSDSEVASEHFIIIGQPQDNSLIPLLNELADLPVSLHQQQLGLEADGPTMIAPSDTFTYNFTVTNTIDQKVDLTLLNTPPIHTEFVDCTPKCVVNEVDSSISWDDVALAPDENQKFSLSLKATDILTSTDLVENKLTVIDAEAGPVNANTMASAAVSDVSGQEWQHIKTEEQSYFFVYDGQTIATDDGIIQEIVSPWNDDRAILILTGLNEKAVRKASQAMSSQVRLPGLKGTVAIVRDVLPPDLANREPLPTERTLADLGYDDQVVGGGVGVQPVDFYFYVPHGWQMTDESALDLYFSHSQLIDYEASGLTVLINQQPVASVTFDETTALDGHLYAPLMDADIRPGQSNRLTVAIDATVPGICNTSDQNWVLVKQKSKINLAHREETGVDLNINLYPYPFHLNPTFTDLLFVLPEVPNQVELENALRIAAALGNYTDGQIILPKAIMGDNQPDPSLEDYHIIAIGRPSRNKIIQQANQQLPQPFLAGSDQIDQHIDNVTLRLPSDIDLAYIQLLPSIWNSDRALLVITGTTDQSISRAVDVLLTRPWAMNGNLALIRDDGDIQAIDTRRLVRAGIASAIATAVPESTLTTEGEKQITTTVEIGATASPTASLPSSASSPNSPVPLSRETSYPVWLIPLVVMTSLIVVAIFAFVLWQFRRHNN